MKANRSLLFILICSLVLMLLPQPAAAYGRDDYVIGTWESTLFIKNSDSSYGSYTSAAITLRDDGRYSFSGGKGSLESYLYGDYTKDYSYDEDWEINYKLYFGDSSDSLLVGLAYGNDERTGGVNTSSDELVITLREYTYLMKRKVSSSGSSSSWSSGSSSGYGSDSRGSSSTGLVISDVKVSKGSIYTSCEGKVTNKGNSSYKFIKVTGDFVDRRGNVIDTDWSYACGAEGLAPGESTSFYISVKNNSSIDTCKVSLMDYTLMSGSSYGSSYSSSGDLKISGVKVENNSISTVCTGTVTNNGSRFYKFVEVRGAFKDSRGNVLDVESTYAAGSEGLEPGESSKFWMSVSKDTDIRSCDVSILDYDVATKPSYAPMFTISNVRIEQGYSSTYCKGTIKNTGSTTYEFVTVKGAFKNSSGKVIDTDNTYAVGSEGLAPGESAEFSMFVDKDYSITSCTVTVIDYSN